MNPNISVIMSCFNCEKTINRAIDSIIAQTYTNWVMICCDDGSTDRTYDILCVYQERFPEKFIIIQNKENKKLAYSLNRCLELVKTEYVARQDADDESLPERFEKQMHFLQTNTDCILCGTKILFINDFSGRNHVSTVEENPDKYTLFHHTPFNHATIMCHKNLYDILKGYSESKTAIRCEDKDLWYRFFSNELKGKNLNEPLYQLHENKELIYRNTVRSRWNDFVTDLRGYKLLCYPWFWYYKPLIDLCKAIIPKSLMVLYYTFFRK